jgi:hypothetical protein
LSKFLVGHFTIFDFDFQNWIPVMLGAVAIPAAMDDAMSVWREAIQMQDPRNMAIFGTSTRGGMTLAMILRASPLCSGGDRARYAMIRSDRDWRHLQDQ